MVDLSDLTSSCKRHFRQTKIVFPLMSNPLIDNPDVAILPCRDVRSTEPGDTAPDSAPASPG